LSATKNLAIERGCGGFSRILLVFIRENPPHPRHPRSINTYTGVKKAPGLWHCYFALLRKPDKLDSLPYIRDAVFIVSGRHHSDLNDSSGFM